MMMFYQQMGKRLALLGLLLIFVISCQPPEAIIPVVLTEVPLEPGRPIEVAVNPRTGYAYITNEGAHINVLDSAWQQVASIQTGERRPDAIAIDERGGWVYIVNDYSSSVTVMQELEVKAILEVEGFDPRGVAVNPTTGWAYVVSGYRQKTPSEKRTVEGNVTVMQGTEVIGVIPLGRVLATKVVVDPINNLVYVGGVGGEVIVIREMIEIARFNVGAGINAIDVNPHNGDVYVLAPTAEGNVSYFREGQLIGRIYIERAGGSMINLKVHPVTGDVYVVDFIAQEVAVVRLIDGQLQLIGHVPAGSGPRKAVIDPFTSHVYVANQYDDTVTVIHGTEAIATLDVGWTPYGIGVNPTNGQVYVLNTQGNSVTIVGLER